MLGPATAADTANRVPLSHVLCYQTVMPSSQDVEAITTLYRPCIFSTRQVQGAWLVAHLTDQRAAAAVLLPANLARPLVSMLHDGQHEVRTGGGGGAAGSPGSGGGSAHEGSGTVAAGTRDSIQVHGRDGVYFSMSSAAGGGTAGSGSRSPPAGRSPLAGPLDYNAVAAATGALLGLARLQHRAPADATSETRGGDGRRRSGGHGQVLSGGDAGLVLSCVDGRVQVMAEMAFQVRTCRSA